MNHGLVPDLHGYQPGLRNAHRCKLIERHMSSVSFDLYRFDQTGRRPPRPQASEFLLENVDGAMHPALQVVETKSCRGHHIPRNTAFPRQGLSEPLVATTVRQPPTMVARLCPCKVAVIAPGSRIENTMIGIRFSRASAKAVASITLSSCRRASSWVRRS